MVAPEGTEQTLEGWRPHRRAGEPRWWIWSSWRPLEDGLRRWLQQNGPGDPRAVAPFPLGNLDHISYVRNSLNTPPSQDSHVA